MHLACNLKNYLNQFDTQEQIDKFMKEFNQLFFSSSETSLNDSLIKFRSKFSNSRGANEYFLHNFIPVKKFIVQLGTDFVRHFDNTTTSWAEGQHQVLKEYFSFSTGDLLPSGENFHLSSKNHFHGCHAKLEQKKIKVYHRHNTIHDNNRGNISSIAIE